jgi:pimeloyl-ACP methyl ester carboxylesterase
MRRLLIVLGSLITALVAVLLIVSRLVARRERVVWEDAAKPGKLVDVAGAPIHYVDEGGGPPVVLIHGFGGHTFSYRYQIADLSRDHRVVALDLLGYGYSGRTVDADYSLTAQAERVLGLMDALGIERASLVGHSMGGAVAMRVAAGHPDRVERLALVASVSGDAPPRFRGLRIMRPMLPLMSHIAVDRILRASFSDPSKITAEVRDAYTDPMRIRGSMDGLHRMMADAKRDEVIKYERIIQPTLILWGEDERLLPGFMLDRLRQRLPRAELVTVIAAGHQLLEEQPAACNRVLREFLAASPSDQADTEETARPSVSSQH